MRVMTSRETSLVPFRQVQLNLVKRGTYTYTGWFIAFDLTRYVLIPGKEFMEEVGLHIDDYKNALHLD